MAYRKEKEENGEYAIVLDGWDEGIADDPYSGINMLTNANINGVPGEVSVGFTLSTNTTSGATLGKPISRATNLSSGTATAYYILDDAGQVWSSTTVSGTYTFLSSGNTITGSSNLDAIVAFNGFVLKFRNTSIDYWNGSTWTNGWKTIVGVAQHYAILALDNTIYFCNGNGIGSIQQVAGKSFDPTDITTFTFNASALLISSWDLAQSIAELSSTLLVGGSLNAIYPWDRVSTSFRYPIFIADSFITRMVTANTNVFIFAGGTTNSGSKIGRGRIFLTNGTNANLYFKIPDFLTSREEPYYLWGDAIYYRDNLIFGFQPMSNANTSVPNLGGVWALDLETKAFRQISNATGYANVLIANQNGSSVPGMAYSVGLFDSSNNYSIQNSSTSAGTGIATAISDTIPIGTAYAKKTFSQVEFKLGVPLASGESIALLAIYDLNNSVSIGTWSTVGDFSGVFPVTFEKNQWLSIQANLTGNSSSGVRLKEIRIR